MTDAVRALLNNPFGRALRRLYRVFRPHSEVIQQRKLERIARMARTARVPATGAVGSKRVLINAHFVWNYGPVEYALAAALRERGHEVLMVACGGLPDYCQLQNTTQERPPCDHCLANVTKRFDAYRLPHTNMAAHISAADIAFARDVAASTPAAEIKSVMEGNVPVGYLASINLFQYFKGFSYEFTAEVEAVMRRCLSSAILTTRASHRIMDEFKPDVFVTINGKFLHWAPFIQYCRTKKIPFITWEDFQVTPSTVMFASNDVAHEQMQLETWQMAMAVPLSESQKGDLHDLFKLWSTGAVTPWAGFGSDASHDAGELRALLRLSKDRPIVSLFPNIAWDSSSVGFETAFESIFDWLTKTISYAAKRPELDFVIRTHPAESRLPPEFKSRITTAEAIAKYGPPLPANVRIVKSGDPVNSYTLAEMSAVAMTYTSTLGMELPLRGIRPWVAGGPYYAGKGLSVDLTSPEHMYALLDANDFPERLTPVEIERAERLAYLVRFRGTFEFPFLTGHELALDKWSSLAPGGNSIISDLCDRVLNAKPMIDLRDPPDSPFGRPSSARKQ